MADNAFRWVAQPLQRLFLQQKTFEALYGGSAGGGKTEALLMFAISRRLKYPGSAGLMVRRTIEELKKEGSLIPRSHEILSGKWAWSGMDKKWRAPNGSVLEFGYCKYESDVYHYQSSAYADICFDEATHMAAFQYEYLKSRVRSAAGVPAAVRCATNPGNISHAYFKNRFVTITTPGKIYTDPETGLERVFIPAKLTDNKILMEKDPGYINRLRALPENERRALLDGDWDVFKGQYFPEFRYDRHVCEPFPIPKEWPRERSIDWGMTRPTVCYWYAMSPENRAYVYREYYATGFQAADAARNIKELSVGEKYIRTWCDPSMFAKKGEGLESIAAQMQRHLGTLMPSKNERVSGWQAVRKWFALAADGRPNMIFFNTCLNAIRTIPELIYDSLRVEDLDTMGVDDCADSIRYWAVNHHQLPKHPTSEKYPGLPGHHQEFWERFAEEVKVAVHGPKHKNPLDILDLC